MSVPVNPFLVHRPMPEAAPLDDASALAGIQAELGEARKKIENLKLALESSRRIGIAIGILMRDRRCDADAAFRLLVAVSQHTHRKVRDIAEDVCDYGTVVE